MDLKRHDTQPPLRLQIVDDAGRPLAAALASATSVTFSMKRGADTALKVANAAAVIESVENAIIRYAWQPSDTDTAGNYIGEFEITTPSGKLTYPRKGEPPLRIEIGADLNNA